MYPQPHDKAATTATGAQGMWSLVRMRPADISPSTYPEPAIASGAVIGAGRSIGAATERMSDLYRFPATGRVPETA
jgi:hypothetical protein